MVTPMKPSLPASFRISRSSSSASSMAAALGAIIVLAKSQAISWIICCSSVSSKSMLKRSTACVVHYPEGWICEGANG